MDRADLRFRADRAGRPESRHSISSGGDNGIEKTADSSAPGGAPPGRKTERNIDGRSGERASRPPSIQAFYPLVPGGRTPAPPSPVSGAGSHALGTPLRTHENSPCARRAPHGAQKPGIIRSAALCAGRELLATGRLLFSQQSLTRRGDPMTHSPGYEISGCTMDNAGEVRSSGYLTGSSYSTSLSPFLAMRSS